MRVTRKVKTPKVVQYDEHEETIDVLCDVCGESTETVPGITPEHRQWATLSASWGFGSPYDGEHHTLDICVKCYDQLPEWIKSKIRVTDYAMGQDDRVGLAFR